jgi:glycosyltransferase involved in cell wall biosynthesis
MHMPSPTWVTSQTSLQELDASTPAFPAVTVVLPVYQEEKNIEACIIGIVTLLESEKISFEIVAVDDGSRDDSLHLLLALQERFPDCLRVARHVANKGYGAALRTGIRLARGEIVVCMDADGQHSPVDIPKLLACIPPYDMVVGCRTESYQGAWYRNLANRFYNRFASWLTQTEISDLTSGFRAMRLTAVSHFLHLYPAGFSASTTATMAFLKAGYNVFFTPIHVLPRSNGKSKISLFGDGSNFLVIILRIIMLYDPLRIFMPVAAFLLFLGVVAMVVGMLAAERLVVPGSAVVLFLAALMSILLGLVSSQIAQANIHYYGDEVISVYENRSGRTIGLRQ